MTQWSSTLPSGPYAYGPPVIRVPRRITTSPREILHLLVAAVVLTGDIALITVRTFPIGGLGSVSTVELLVALGFGATAALTGFVFHELAHKIAAQRRGYWAEFRMSPFGLVLSVITSFLGFLFAAPGATVVGEIHAPRDWGRTSLAGPVTNLLEGGAFLAAAYAIFSVAPGQAVVPFLLLLAFFNGWFATFNLIPFNPLDGAKVLRWSGAVWAVSFAVSAVLTVAMFAILFGALPF